MWPRFLVRTLQQLAEMTNATRARTPRRKGMAGASPRDGWWTGRVESLEDRQLFAVDLQLAAQPPQYELVESTHVTVRLTGEVQSASVVAHSLAPFVPGSSARSRGEAVVLFDDGRHGDGSAGDGIYGNRLPLTSQSGTHRIVVNAKGIETSGRSFQDTVQYDIGLTAAAAVIVDDDSDLFAVGRRDGAIQHLGRLPDVMYDIAAAPEPDVYYVIDTNGESRSGASLGRLRLNRFDNSFSYSTVGALPGVNVNALEFRSDGVLFAADQDGLYTVDPQSGQTTLVSEIPNNERSAGDLAFDIVGNVLLTTFSESLYRYEVNSGTWTKLLDTNRDDLYGLVLEHDLLYAFDSPTEQIVEIDTRRQQVMQVKQLQHPLLDGIFGATTPGIGGESFAARTDASLITLTPHDGRLVRHEAGQWSSAIDWRDVQHADVDGDGNLDIVGRAPAGHWWVGRAVDGVFENELWGQWSSRVNWLDVVVGDFNGDGRDDVAGRANGRWWIAVSNGTEFVNENWAIWSPNITWQDVQVADVNGDGMDDIVGRGNGTWWVARSTGAEFVNEPWDRWTTHLQWYDVTVGDFNGDGRDDIAGRTEHGAWWIARSTGASFISERWGGWNLSSQWRNVMIGDFDGDGRDDIVGRINTSWWVSRSNGGSFDTFRVGQWNGMELQDLMFLDITGDGRDDVVGRTSAAWIIGRSSGWNVTFNFWTFYTDLGQWTDVLPGPFFAGI